MAYSSLVILSLFTEPSARTCGPLNFWIKILLFIAILGAIGNEILGAITAAWEPGDIT